MPLKKIGEGDKGEAIFPETGCGLNQYAAKNTTSLVWSMEVVAGH
jgi:hypothetical protein